MTIALNIVKWVSLSFLGLILLAVLSLEGFYHYKIHQLKPQKVYAQSQHDLTSKQTLWVESNESGEIGLKKLSATEYLVKMAYSMMRISNDDQLGSVKDFRLYSLKGVWLASWVARDLHRELAPDASQGQYHINGPIITVWLTRNVAVDDLIGYLLENLYLGGQQHGLNNAAKYYFGKAESQLSTDEIISLISLLKSPSRYHPTRYPKRFLLRTKFMVERLKENWPEQYADYQFSPPIFIKSD